jgi:hypothetical protein
MAPMLRALLISAAVLCAAAPASAGWTYASSDHFEVYTTAGGRRALEALAYFERVRAFFADFLQLTPRETSRTRLVIFSNYREFRPYRPSEVAIAYYWPGTDRDYIVMRSFDAEGFPIVVHEYAHLIARHSGAKYPLWLAEGLAEFFSTLAPYNGQMSVGRIPEGRIEYLRSGRLLGIDRLFAIDHDSPEYRIERHAGVFYAQSWALTHLLVTGSGYRDHWGRFLRLINEARPSAEALQMAFGKPPADVHRDLVDYLAGNQHTYLLVRHQPASSGGEYLQRPVDDFEAALATAAVLGGGPGGEARTRSAYTELAAARPDDLAVLEARAHFEVTRGTDELAEPLLARAVVLGSRNPRILRDYAELLASREGDEPRLVEIAGAAVSLDPQDRRSRLLYALGLLRTRQPERALAELRAIEHVPLDDRFMYFQLVANAYLQLDAIDDARKAAGVAAASVKTDEQRTYMTRLLAQLVRP